MGKRSASSGVDFPSKRNKSSERVVLSAKIESEFILAESPCEYCNSIFPSLCWISNDSLKCSNCVRDNIRCSMSERREHSELVSAFSSLKTKESALFSELVKVRSQLDSLSRRGLAGRNLETANNDSLSLILADTGAQANGSSAIPQEPQNSS
jgi:hypothetical protein